jgi:aerobic C4-dicarboxylate transport protein
VLLFSILFGIVLSKLHKKVVIIRVLSNVSTYVFKALHLVMYLAPLGAFGGMAYTIGRYGIDTLLPLAKLMITVYITMGLFVFVVLHFIMRFYRSVEVSEVYQGGTVDRSWYFVLGGRIAIANGKVRENGL